MSYPDEPYPIPKLPRVVVCTTCNDTHKMYMAGLERFVMCTDCPIPCKSCQRGAFCAATPCMCGCHRQA